MSKGERRLLDTELLTSMGVHIGTTGEDAREAPLGMSRMSRGVWYADERDKDILPVT